MQTSRNFFKNAACLLLASLIVTSSLSIGALAADYDHPCGCSVEVTQLS
jgi:hypothetical protein